MRRPVHDGQNPRFLHENATASDSPHCRQLTIFRDLEGAWVCERDSRTWAIDDQELVVAATSALTATTMQQRYFDEDAG
jgi:hypothetical protein